MNDVDVDPLLVERVRLAMRALAESHQPDPRRVGTAGRRPASSRRRWLAMAAAAVLVVGGVTAVVALAGRDPSTAPSATVATSSETLPEASASSSVATEPSAPSAIAPNADGDVAIDPDRLRFRSPLADGVVAFVDDPSLPRPQLEPGEVVVIGDQRSDALGDTVRFVAMNGTDLLMRGSVVDLTVADAPEAIGPIVDVGVEGARYVDDDEGAIVLPLGDEDVRIVGPNDYFSLGGGGPHVDPATLRAITRAIGAVPISDIDSLPGFFVDDGVVDGETLDPLGMRRGVRVQHGTAAPESTSVTLVRLADPPTALDLIAAANSLTRRGEIDVPAIGEVSMVVADGLYLELVSPVDLLVLSTPDPSGASGLAEAIDFATVDTLDAAFDGVVQAPPPPR